MKRLKRIGILKVICAVVLCAGVVFFVATCEDDDDCKECTNTETQAKKTFCGDELTEAQRADSDWSCK